MPQDAPAFEFTPKQLSENWEQLHRGDLAPWPEQAHLDQLVADFPDAAPANFDGDTEELANSLRQAWGAFHEGRFQEAVTMADRCGLLGHAAANKATGIHATYLEPSNRVQQERFLAAAQRAERAMAALPEDANSHYFHAFTLGRYSQSISVVKALRQGIGGKIQSSLERALALEPDHAEAHTAMGLYHAEIVDKIGKMVGKMTYGASAEKALEHFERALELTPDAPIALMEYGNGLYMLFGDKRLDEVTDLYVKASEAAPQDAMEWLDARSAAEELE
jgi:tetratricopeptide (TPR) repeat protein